MGLFAFPQRIKGTFMYEQGSEKDKDWAEAEAVAENEAAAAAEAAAEASAAAEAAAAAASSGFTGFQHVPTDFR